MDILREENLIFQDFFFFLARQAGGLKWNWGRGAFLQGRKLFCLLRGRIRDTVQSQTAGVLHSRLFYEESAGSAQGDRAVLSEMRLASVDASGGCWRR